VVPLRPSILPRQSTTAVSRFERAGQVTSYLGLVPQEHSSGENNAVVASFAAPIRTAIAARASGVAHMAGLRSENRAFSSVGAGHRSLAWQESGDGGTGSAAGPHVVRDVAGSGRVSAESYASESRKSRDSEYGNDDGGSVTGEVVKLEERARVESWPHVRAVPQRALLLLRIFPCAGTRRAMRERE
jgi:transposase IS116/IS110/IS902 family protein